MQRPHILVAEDDPDLAEFIRQVLESSGYRSTIVSDGRSALDALEHHPFTLVVLDLMMPGMDGIEFRLRQRQHSTQWNTPVLVVSAHYNAEKLASSVGAEGYLPKPFTAEELTAAVTEVITATGRPTPSA